ERSGGAALAVLGGTIVVLGVLVPLAAVVGIPAWVLAVVLRRREGGRGQTAPAQVEAPVGASGVVVQLVEAVEDGEHDGAGGEEGRQHRERRRPPGRRLGQG